MNNQQGVNNRRSRSSEQMLPGYPEWGCLGITRWQLPRLPVSAGMSDPSAAVEPYFRSLTCPYPTWLLMGARQGIWAQVIKILRGATFRSVFEGDFLCTLDACYSATQHTKVPAFLLKTVDGNLNQLPHHDYSDYTMRMQQQAKSILDNGSMTSTSFNIQRTKRRPVAPDEMERKYVKVLGKALQQRFWPMARSSI